LDDVQTRVQSTKSRRRERANKGWSTYEFEHVPVEDIVVGEALAVEQVPEQLPQVRVVWLVVKTQGATKVQVGGKLG
jgi:hypothetical protein